MWRRLKHSGPGPARGADSDTHGIEVRRGRRVAVVQTKDGVWLGYQGGAIYVPRAARKASAPSALGGSRKASGTVSLRAPMAGRIVAQHGQDGSSCRKGETLVVLEAMKMEYRITAPADGRVTASFGALGDAVALDCVLATFVCDADG